MTSPFARTEAPAQASGSPFGQKPSVSEAPATFSAPATEATAAPTGSRFATKRERPDKYPTALDLMPSKVKGTDGALVIVRVEKVLRDQPGQSGGTYDAFDTKTWILDAPRGLPAHVLEAGNEVDGAFYLPEMRWSGAGLERDLDAAYEAHVLFVGRVGAYKPKIGPDRPEFNVTTEAEFAQADAYVNAHPEVEYPKTSRFAQTSA